METGYTGSRTVLTDDESNFVGSLQALLVRHGLTIEKDTTGLPLFMNRGGDGGVFISLEDVHHFLYKDK